MNFIHIGKFTETIYPEDYDFSKCPECCLVLSANTLAKDVLRIQETKFYECLVCLGCPAKKVNRELYGEFIGWKKAIGSFSRPLIVKLKITENAKRSSAFGRKCRCSEAVVLAIENIDGTPSDETEAFSYFDMRFVYRVGETVSVPNFDDYRAKECASGIHFFITRQEAVDL